MASGAAASLGTVAAGHGHDPIGRLRAAVVATNINHVENYSRVREREHVGCRIPRPAIAIRR